MKGYKGFSPGLVCRGKQYAENTVFEEDNAEICRSGMHFCENRLMCWIITRLSATMRKSTNLPSWYKLENGEFVEVTE